MIVDRTLDSEKGISPKISAHSFVKNVVGVFASQVISLFLGIISSVVMNRALGPSGRGIYATALTVVTYLGLFSDWGISKAATYFIAENRQSQDRSFRVLVLLSIGSLILLALMTLESVTWLVPRFLPSLPQGLALPILALGICTLLNSRVSGTLRGLKAFGQINLYGIFQSLVFVGALLLLVPGSSLNPYTVVLSRVVSFVVIIVMAVVSLSRKGFNFTPVYDRMIVSNVLTYGAGYFLFTLLQNLNYRFDIFLLANLTDNTSVGWYSTGVGLAELIWYFPAAVGFVLLPIAVEMQGNDRGQVVACTCRWTLLLMSLAVIVSLPIIPFLVTLLYGKEFLPSVPVFYSLAIGIVANGLFSMLGTYLAAQRLMGTLSWVTAAGFVSNLLLNLVLIPRWGIIGAGISSTISYSVSGLLAAQVFRKKTGISWRMLLFPTAQDISSIIRAGRRFLQRWTLS